jgi:hypothetical protein
MKMRNILKTGAVITLWSTLLGSAAFSDTIKRTIVPAQYAVTQVAQTLPRSDRDAFTVGMLNLIFTHQPRYGEGVVAHIMNAYSTDEVISLGRSVQQGTN